MKKFWLYILNCVCITLLTILYSIINLLLHLSFNSDNTEIFITYFNIEMNIFMLFELSNILLIVLIFSSLFTILMNIKYFLSIELNKQKIKDYNVLKQKLKKIINDERGEYFD